MKWLHYSHPYLVALAAVIAIAWDVWLYRIDKASPNPLPPFHWSAVMCAPLGFLSLVVALCVRT